MKQWRVLLICLMLIGIYASVQAQSDYNEILEGDMPLLIACEHGGWKQVGDVQVSTGQSDTLVREYVMRILIPRIHALTGCMPYVVFCQGRRDYVNCNRYVDDSEAYGSVDAETVYMAYHDQVDAFIAALESRFGSDTGILINMHTTELPQSLNDKQWDRIAEIGVNVSVTNLASISNTMRVLYDRKGAAALRGADSIPYMFYHGNDWPAPDAVWPAVATVNSKTLTRIGQDVFHVLPALVDAVWDNPHYWGLAVIEYHGTNSYGHHANWINGLDAFQVEFNILRDSGLAMVPADPGYDPAGSENQLDIEFSSNVADKFVRAVLESLRVNYDWQPEDTYTAIVENNTDGFSITGFWEVSTALGYWGQNPSLYSLTVGDTAEWRPMLESTGQYEVFVRWTKAQTRTSNALYRVHHATGSNDIMVDQNSGLDAKWISMGQYTFNAGTGSSVKLHVTDAYPTSADAVMFKMVSGIPPINHPPFAHITVNAGDPWQSGVIGISDALAVDSAWSFDPDGDIDGYEWDFGDGQTGSAMSETHYYAAPSRYEVTLTITDNQGLTDVERVRIHVLDNTYIVDNDRQGFTVDAPGQWQEASGTARYAATALQTDATGETASWQTNLAAAGQYKVTARWPDLTGLSSVAAYTVYHGAGNTLQNLDQTQNSGQWIDLGIYDFNAGQTGSVVLECSGDPVCADAVRWQIVPEDEDFILHFKFDEISGEHADDSSGNNHDGFKYGPEWTDQGLMHGALAFDGVEDYVLAPYDMVSGYPFSLAVWVQTNLPSTANRRIVELTDRSGFGSVYAIFISYGKACLGVNGPSSSWTDLNSGQIVNDGAWHHIAAVLTNDTSKKLYVDGQFHGEMTDNVLFSDAVNSITIGRDGDASPNSQRYFQGLMDDVRVYSRALDPAEINVMAQTPTPAPPCIHNGDVDNSGVVTSGDAQAAFQIAMSMLTPTAEEECRADCDASGTVSFGDAQIIFQASLGMGPTCEDAAK